MSDDNVITVDAWVMRDMPRNPRDELPAENIARCVMENVDSLSSLAAFGINNDGTLFAATSMPHTADVLLLIDRVRKKLMEQFDGDTFG